VRIKEELKQKRADLLGEVEQLALRIEAIKKQVSAIDLVIAIYDPAHTALLAATAGRTRTRQEVPLPIALVQLNKTAAILEALREANQPLSTADCTNRIAEKHGVAVDHPSLPLYVRHVSAGADEPVSRTRRSSFTAAAGLTS
jgi:hypothetical protein